MSGVSTGIGPSPRIAPRASRSHGLPSMSGVARASAVEIHVPGRDQLERAREKWSPRRTDHPLLMRVAVGLQQIRRVPREGVGHQRRDGKRPRAQEWRPLIELVRDEVHGRSGVPFARKNGVADGPQARKPWPAVCGAPGEVAVVHIDDSVPEEGQHRLGDHVQIAREHDEIEAEDRKALDRRGIIGRAPREVGHSVTAGVAKASYRMSDHGDSVRSRESLLPHTSPRWSGSRRCRTARRGSDPPRADAAGPGRDASRGHRPALVHTAVGRRPSTLRRRSSHRLRMYLSLSPDPRDPRDPRPASTNARQRLPFGLRHQPPAESGIEDHRADPICRYTCRQWRFATRADARAAR